MWDEPEFPHKGWSLVDSYDMGEGESQPCQMSCGANPRFIHVLRHPQYPREIHVGLICAEHLTQDYANVDKRERRLRSEAESKRRFTTTAWTPSKSGASWFRKLRGYIAIAWRGEKYSIAVKRDGQNGKGFLLGSFDTPMSAKTAAYEWIAAVSKDLSSKNLRTNC